MERNLALELVRVTEAAALASSRWMGKGNGLEADRAAREAVSIAIKSVKIKGTIVIGERINPTGKKRLAAALIDGDLEFVRREARAQIDAGAGVIDVNVGTPGVDEVKLLPEAVRAVMESVDAPVSIDTANPEALRAALEAETAESSRSET